MSAAARIAVTAFFMKKPSIPPVSTGCSTRRVGQNGRSSTTPDRLPSRSLMYDHGCSAGRLRYWLHAPQAPKYGVSFSASERGTHYPVTFMKQHQRSQDS